MVDRSEFSIALCSAQTQADAVQARDVSSSELLEITLERYERLNPAINAVVATQLDVARDRASEADAATARGESWGPLHGVPMTIKEAWDWIGSASTSGYPERADWRPDRNSEAVQRLLDAGAVIYGKTNLPVGMADWQTFNPVYGTTGNPWDPEMIPGGSSGGASAALAAGLTALELGSDIGASIRNPAHYCGVFGHKPTYGLVPDAGHGNPGSPVSLDIGVGGPMSRYASDLQLGLDIVAGAGGLDARGWKLDLPESRRNRPDEWRVAVMLDHEVCEVDGELVDQLTSTVEGLGSLGVQLDWEARPDIDIARMHDVYIALLRAATGTEFSLGKYEAMGRHADRYDGGDRDYRARAARAVRMSHWEWAAYHDERERARLAWDAFFDEYDALLCPTASSAAYPHDQDGDRADRMVTVNGKPQSTTDQLFWAGLSCGVYLPGTVAPAGLTTSGLPCGLQIVTGHLRDREGIAFAEMMERELGGYMVPPGYE